MTSSLHFPLQKRSQEQQHTWTLQDEEHSWAREGGSSPNCHIREEKKPKFLAQNHSEMRGRKFNSPISIPGVQGTFSLTKPPPRTAVPEVNICQFHSPKSSLLPQRGSPAAHGRYLNETLSSNPQHLAGREWQLGGCFAPGNYLFSLIISILFGSAMPGCSLCLIQRPSREMTL